MGCTDQFSRSTWCPHRLLRLPSLICSPSWCLRSPANSIHCRDRVPLHLPPEDSPGYRVPGYPFSNTPAVISTPELVAGGLPIQVVPAPLPAPEDADVLKVVNVASEETDDNEIAAPGLITVAEEIDELPSPPTSLFRDPIPVIPAGIAQATQPIFHQQLFKNPKLAPFLVQYPNSKISPVLQEIRGHGAIVV